MSEENKTIEYKIRISELLPNLLEYPMLVKYFDFESNKNLKHKIDVLEKIGKGIPINEIEWFYEAFELLPKEGIWD